MADVLKVAKDLESLNNNFSALQQKVNNHEQRLSSVEQHLSAQSFQIPVDTRYSTIHSNDSPNLLITPSVRPSANQFSLRPIVDFTSRPITYPLPQPTPVLASYEPMDTHASSPLQQEVNIMGKRVDSMQGTLSAIYATLFSLGSGASDNSQ